MSSSCRISCHQFTETSPWKRFAGQPMNLWPLLYVLGFRGSRILVCVSVNACARARCKHGSLRVREGVLLFLPSPISHPPLIPRPFHPRKFFFHPVSCLPPPSSYSIALLFVLYRDSWGASVQIHNFERQRVHHTNGTLFKILGWKRNNFSCATRDRKRSALRQYP